MFIIMIKNIVIGSGGHNLIRMIGCIEKLMKVDYIKNENIENILLIYKMSDSKEKECPDCNCPKCGKRENCICNLNPIRWKDLGYSK